MSYKQEDHEAGEPAFFDALSLNLYCRDQARRAGKARARVDWHRESDRSEGVKAEMIIYDFHHNLAKRSRVLPMLWVPVGSVVEVAKMNHVRQSEPLSLAGYLGLFCLLFLVAALVRWVGLGHYDGFLP